MPERKEKDHQWWRLALGHEHPWIWRLRGASQSVPAQVSGAGGREGFHVEDWRAVWRKRRNAGGHVIHGNAGWDEWHEWKYASARHPFFNADDAAAALWAAATSWYDVCATPDDVTVSNAYAEWWRPASWNVGSKCPFRLWVEEWQSRRRTEMICYAPILSMLWLELRSSSEEALC